MADRRYYVASVLIGVVVWTGENDTKTIIVDANLFCKRSKTAPFSFGNGLVSTGPEPKTAFSKLNSENWFPVVLTILRVHSSIIHIALSTSWVKMRLNPDTWRKHVSSSKCYCFVKYTLALISFLLESDNCFWRVVIAAAASEPEANEQGSSLISRRLHYRGLQSLFLTKRKVLWLCASGRFRMRSGMPQGIVVKRKWKI